MKTVLTGEALINYLLQKSITIVPSLASGTKIATIKTVKGDVSLYAPAGGGSGAVTGVKGSAETNYRTGNVSLSPSNIGAAAINHTHSNVTTTTNGFMIAADKSKLDGIEAGAQKNTITGVKGSEEATYRTGQISLSRYDIGAAAADHSHLIVTNEKAGFMSIANKIKLDGIEAQANKTVVDSTMSASSTNPVQNKVAKAYIDNAISGITGFEIQVVQALPASGSKGVIYLVPHTHGASDNYDEYIWVTDKFEKIGNTDIDLSGYYTKAETDAKLSGKQNTITSSTNLQARSVAVGSEFEFADVSGNLILKPGSTKTNLTYANKLLIDDNNIGSYAATNAITNAEIDIICS